MATKTTKMSQQDIIKKFMYSLDINEITLGKEALNQAICYASGGHFTDATSAINVMIKELNTYGAKNFLSSRCGINLSNSDTGAITGSDAGGSSTKTATSIVPESGKLNSSFNATSFTTKDGLTIRIRKTPTTADEKYIWRAIKTWWAEEGLNLIKNSYGYSFKDSDAKVKDLTIELKNDTKSTFLAYTDYPQTINGNYTRLLTINMKYFNSFKTGDVNGKSSDTPGYLDRTFAHELTHVIMMAKVNTYKGLPQFITEGLGELTHGIDDLGKEVILALVNDPEKLKKALKLTSGTGSANSYAGGYIFLRWFAKQAAINYPSVNQSLTLKSGKIIFGDDNDNSIASGTGNDTIFSNAGNDTIKGEKGADILWGNDGNDLIFGGVGNDTLNGGAGKDTLNGGTGDDWLTGGTGNDTFVYTVGKDTITDYETGDKISIDAAISNSRVNGSDVIFTFENGRLTVKEAKGKKITLIDAKGKEYSTIVGGTTLIVNDLTESPVTAKSEIKVIDASERTTKVKITGNKLDNMIIGGTGTDTINGGSGNDSVMGGKGNDCLYGDEGNDTILGGKGVDSIWGGTGNDKLYGESNHDILYGEAGNDSLWGGSGNDKLYGNAGNDMLVGGVGNDSLWGDAGADTFYYAKGDGNDIIFGFDNKDTLTLDGLDFTTSYDKKNKAVTFNVEGGSVTLKDFTATTFHVNGDTYKISKNQLVKK